MRVCVVGSDGAVGAALVTELEGRGMSVLAVPRERAWRHEHEDLEGVVSVCVDTRVWWGDEGWEEGARAFRGWLERAHREAAVAQVLVVTSAATLGRKRGEIGELEMYVMGSGEAWEDRVWRMEGEAYGWMARGLEVWFALPTMVAQEERFKALVRGGEEACEGDVVSAADVARGCVQVLSRGRAGRRYVLAGEQVRWRGGVRGGYLEGRVYAVEAASGELGYGVREDVSWVGRKEGGGQR